MATVPELLRQGRRAEIWKKCCGFIDLSLKEFMEIQARLLMEQIDLLSRCELGRSLLGGKVPSSVEEFRQTVPLTTYEDYAPYLLEKREDVLPARPMFWARTSGRSGEYEFKWIPFPAGVFWAQLQEFFSSFIFASCRDRGDFVLEEYDKFLYCLAPPPYGSGWVPYQMPQIFPFDFLPPAEEAEQMSFEERISEGFRLAIREGLDVFLGIGSVLVRIGEQFAQQSGKMKISSFLSQPKSLLRLIRGSIRSKLAARPMLPKDLWDLKGIVLTGTDSSIYRDKIEYYWGKSPVEFYGATELHIVAMQTWDREGMTFVPSANFLEFIPEEEYLKAENDPGYQPRTVLLDKVEAGKVYEIVATNFMGGPFVRYRVRDLIKITSLRNEELEIDIPQMVFESRGDEVIDLAAFTRLTEKIIWQAIQNSGVEYVDWTVRKEIEEQQPVLHLYIELKGDDQDIESIGEAIHSSLRNLDSDYKNLEEMLGLKPLRVTPLPPNAFQRYYQDRKEAGADLAHLKPPHMKPSDRDIERLLRSGEQEAPS
jgi:hypothetical protein